MSEQDGFEFIEGDVETSDSAGEPAWVISKHSCPSSQVGGGSTSGWTPRSEEVFAGAFTLRGTRLHAPAWRRALAKLSWLQALSGLTFRPSKPDVFADSLTSWLAEAHAKTSASPENAQVSREREAVSSSNSPESSRNVSLESSSGKTSQEHSEPCRASSTSSSESGTRGKLSAFELLTWERPTDGNEYSFWPTATAQRSGNNCGGAAGRVGTMRPSLETKAAMWPTATATDAKARGARAYSTESGRHSGVTLTDATVRNWPTPTTRDWKDGADLSENTPTNCLLGRAGPRSLPARMTSTGGVSTSRQEDRRRLNPSFVEALMGWPVGHSIPFGLTGCGCSGTESFQSKPKKPSDFSQTELFGEP